MNKKEIWKTVPGFSKYEVSDLGNLRKLKKDKSYKYLSNNTRSKGYIRNSMTNDLKEKKYKDRQVLIALTFLDHRHNKILNLVVDHIDNDPLNNKLNNLQVITTRKNCSKDKNNKTSKYTGVNRVKKTGKWVSRIKIDGKVYHLGHFILEEDAAKAYLDRLKNYNAKTTPCTD